MNSWRALAEHELNKSYDGKAVVITHHGPTVDHGTVISTAVAPASQALLATSSDRAMSLRQRTQTTKEKFVFVLRREEALLFHLLAPPH